MPLPIADSLLVKAYDVFEITRWYETDTRYHALFNGWQLHGGSYQLVGGTSQLLFLLLVVGNDWGVVGCYMLVVCDVWIVAIIHHLVATRQYFVTSMHTLVSNL